MGAFTQQRYVVTFVRSPPSNHHLTATVTFPKLVLAFQPTHRWDLREQRRGNGATTPAHALRAARASSSIATSPRCHAASCRFLVVAVLLRRLSCCFLECLAAPPFVQCPAASPIVWCLAALPSVPPWGGGGRAGRENRRPTPLVEELSCVSPYPSTSFTAPVMQMAVKIFFCFSAQRAWILINPPQLSTKMQNIMQPHVSVSNDYFAEFHVRTISCCSLFHMFYC